MWLILLAVLLVVHYYKSIKPLSYWKDRGVAHKRPLPVFGNSGVIFFKNKSLLDNVECLYNEFPNERYFGVHHFSKPALYIKDLELIKQITIKDFDHFVDRKNVVPEEVEPIMGKNLANLKGQKWRNMRTSLSPAFTSSKIKSMFKLLSECSQDFTEYFKRQGDKLVEVEMKEIFSRFTNDAIASIAFGVKCDSLTEKSNEFYVMGKRATNLGGSTLILFSLITIFPFLPKIIKISLLPQEVTSFFQRVIKDTIQKREKEGFIRHDMINLLLEARKNGFKHEEKDTVDTGFATVPEYKINQHEKHCKLQLTDDDITAQALAFFSGGFDTSSTLMSFMSHELAINREAQQKLQNEIDDTLSKCNGKITYEALHKMRYMDMVVSETLRKWPPGFQLERECVKDYVIEAVNPHEKSLLIEKGSMILIPVAGIHRDPQHFENPHVFNPERFSDENKSKIQPYSYIPFGSGPRSCIASRFALMQNKILMFHLLSKFNIIVTPKTSIPIKLIKGSLNLMAEDGFWLGLEARKLPGQN